MKVICPSCREVFELDGKTVMIADGDQDNIGSVFAITITCSICSTEHKIPMDGFGDPS